MESRVRISITCQDSESGVKTPIPRSLIEEIQSNTGDDDDSIVGVSAKFAQSRLLKSPPMDIIIALGTAGVFTTVVQIINKFLEKHDNREIIFEHGDTKIAIKGHNPKDTEEIFNKLFSAAERKRLIEAGLGGTEKKV